MRRVLFVAVLAAALAGCGDSGVSKSDYIAKADKICTQFDRQLNALPKPADANELADFADKAVPISSKGIGQLKDLDKPSGGFGDQAGRMISGLEEGTKLIQELAAAAKAQDIERIRAVGTRATARSKVFEREARAAGFKSCGIDNGS
jgi:hypothetical protein